MTLYQHELKNAYIGEYGWTPGANTIAYYPLNSTTTVKDMSGNNRNLTNNGVTFGTYAGVSCASFPNANAKRLSGTVPLTGNQKFTFSTYIQRLGNSPSGSEGNSQIFVIGGLSTSGCFGACVINSTTSVPGNRDKYKVWTWGTDKVLSNAEANPLNQWKLITVVNDTSSIKVYINGTLIGTETVSFNVNSTSLSIGSFPTQYNSYWQSFYGYMSEFIIENKVRTAQEIANYYNSTKSNYGL